MELLNAVLIMIPIDEPISCFLPVIAIRFGLSQKLRLVPVNYRVSHEPIKPLKTAKEKRTKNRLTKKPQK